MSDKAALQKVVTEALMGMIASVTNTTPPPGEAPPPFIQSAIDRATSRIYTQFVAAQPVTIKTPARRRHFENDEPGRQPYQNGSIDGWNAALDEVQRLNK